jgi:hypothetical protein
VVAGFDPWAEVKEFTGFEGESVEDAEDDLDEDEGGEEEA